MLQRFLFIGVGGSGGETLRHLRRDLMTRLHEAGIQQMPAGWQFLHIDSRTTQEYIDDLPQLPNGDYFGLIEPRVTYDVVARQLESRNALGAARVSCLGWRPDPNAVHTQLDKGAGQYRAIGRSIAITRLSAIKTRVDQALNRVVMADMTEATTALLNAEAVGPPQSPVAVVLSSLAGGSGSGMFMDVCDILRGSGQPWAAEPVAVLYAPDVFNGLKENLRRGVQPNALAAISELLAGYWVGDPEQDLLHRAAGIEGHDRQRSGPGYAFLVGASNDSSKLTFTHQQEVFGAVARAMFAWATNPAIQNEYSAYLAGNWQQQAEHADPLGLSEERLMMPFSALGYASVGLGRDVFHRYAGQCLARATAERLLNGVVAGGRGGTMDIEERVRQRRTEFIAAVLGLSTVDAQLDGELVSKNLPGQLDPGRAAALQQERNSVHSSLGERPRSMAEWKQQIEGVITERVPGFTVQRRTALRVPVSDWINAVQDRLRELVATSLALDGLPVTCRLVDTMINILLGEAAPGMEQNAITDEEFAGQARYEIERATL
ncbi:MAG TPA: tubulin-like doman-containing protein, partial [Pseudonocardiaceae bacterium]